MKTKTRDAVNAFIERNKHALLLLYFMIYLPWFGHLERTVTTHFHVIHVADGNDFAQLAEAFKEAKETKGMPTAIIAHTLKGKGVSYMEGQVGWHGKAPNDEEYAIAMEELGKAGEALCQK